LVVYEGVGEQGRPVSLHPNPLSFIYFIDLSFMQEFVWTKGSAAKIGLNSMIPFGSGN
jgi:hypothetical protein